MSGIVAGTVKTTFYKKMFQGNSFEAASRGGKLIFCFC